MSSNNKKRIYLDYSATTPVRQEVVEAMLPIFTKHFGNPSSIHQDGQEAKAILDAARKVIADTINASPEMIYFTSGGTEADDWALRGVMEAAKERGKTHLITSAVEHHGVLHTAEALEKQGYRVTYLPVDSLGHISLEDLKNAITPETALVSIMYVNNEIGTVSDIRSISKICKENGVLFHTDAVQAYGNFRIDVKELGIDLMSFSSHKIYGPKGVGALYIGKGIRIRPLIYGGAQERSRRAGTENLPGIVGFAKAAEVIYRDFDKHVSHIRSIRDELIEKVLAKVPYSRLNGDPVNRHPGNAHFAFEFIEGEALLLGLNFKGVEGSSGSACTSGSLDPSHVLMGIGLTHEIAHGSLRLTIGDDTDPADVDYIVDAIVSVVHTLRMMSPLYDRVLKAK